MECGLERGKCDVDDGAVDERQAAAEDGGGQNPGTGLRGTRRVGGSGLDDGFVAGEAHSGYGCREAAEGSVEPKHKSDGREAPLGSRVPVGACDSFWLLTHHLRGGFAFAAASRPGRGTATCKLRNANYGFSESLTPTCRSSCKGEPEQVASDQSWFYGRVM